jgi:membrane-bound lytic murein transglycosylase A
MRRRAQAALLATVCLGGCVAVGPSPLPVVTSTAPPVHPSGPGSSAPTLSQGVPPAPPERVKRPGPFDGLAGWAQDDHVAAFRAFAGGCVAARDDRLMAVCRRARALGGLDEAAARAFLEANFRPDPEGDPGLLTAYFTPVYEARTLPEGDFTAPLRPRPADLPRADAHGALIYADRAAIEARPAPDALAWMRPEDLFFLQIQGSGVLIFPDQPPLRAVFDGSNGAPFLGLAAPMRRQGLLADEDTSAERIRAWLVSHRGPEADRLMRLDRRYVFFRLEPDDGLEPAGASGVRLIPGRSLAVDQDHHPMGEVLWLDASAPGLSGAFPAYRRLALALDTGGAIKGEIRADLYLGRGPDAGLEAGRVRHVLKLYRLTPVEPPAS